MNYYYVIGSKNHAICVCVYICMKKKSEFNI